MKRPLGIVVSIALLFGVGLGVAAPATADEPLGGPIDEAPAGLTSEAVPESVAETATASQWRSEQLMPVLSGVKLGGNARYPMRSVNPSNWAEPNCSAVRGDVARIQIASACDAGKLTVATIDPANRTETSRKTTMLATDFPQVGGVLLAADGSVYVLTGAENPDESSAKKVYRVQRFNAALNLIGEQLVSAGQVPSGVKSPFAAGSPGMVVVDSFLHIHLGRTMFKASDGANHQANVTLTMNADLSGNPRARDLKYSSHSFKQLAAAHSSDLIIADHGDAYPREMTIGSITNPGSTTVAPSKFSRTLQKLQGTIGANTTYATLNGLVVAGKQAITVGLSAPHENQVQGLTGVFTNTAGQSASNVYFSRLDLEGRTTQFQWLTNNHPQTSKTVVRQPTVTALLDGTVAVIFQVDVPSETKTTLEFRRYTATGSLLAAASFNDIPYLPVADPIVVSDKIYWVGGVDKLSTTTSAGQLYGISLSDPAKPTLLRLTESEFSLTPTPAILGNSNVGADLRAETGSWQPAPTRFLFQWQRDGEPIPGATNATYRITDSDLGGHLTVTVSAAKPGYKTTSLTSKPTGAVTKPTKPTKPPVTPKPPNTQVKATQCALPRTATVFADVPTSAKFFREIDWMHCKKLSTGIKQADGSIQYGAKAPLTREAMAAFIYRLESPKGFEAPAASPFADVRPGDKFYTEIAWMHAKGLSTGNKNPSGGKPLYAPKQSLTREAMAAFIYRLEGKPPIKQMSSSPFVDIWEGSQFETAIFWMSQSKLSTGYAFSPGMRQYKPKEPLTREAMAAFIYRLEREYRPSR